MQCFFYLEKSRKLKDMIQENSAQKKSKTELNHHLEQLIPQHFNDFSRNFVILFSFLFFFSFSGEAQFIEPNNQTIEEAGDIILYSLPATALATTLIIEDREGTWQFAKGFVLNGAVTVALKYAINKRRPFNDGGQAFPSGHTSVTFQSASFIQRRYGWGYGIPAYLLAGFTGYSRINATRHDGWDVLAGIVVGVGSTYIFTTPYQREHMQLTFKSNRDSWLLGFTYSF